MCPSKGEEGIIPFVLPQPLSSPQGSRLVLEDASAIAQPDHTLCASEFIKLIYPSNTSLLQLPATKLTSDSHFIDYLNSQCKRLGLRFSMHSAEGWIDFTSPPVPWKMELSPALAAILALNPLTFIPKDGKVSFGPVNLYAPLSQVAILCHQLEPSAAICNQSNLRLLGVLAFEPAEDEGFLEAHLLSRSSHHSPLLTATSTASLSRFTFSLQSLTAPTFTPCLQKIALHFLLQLRQTDETVAG